MPMVCIYVYTRVRVPIYMYGVGFGVAVWIKRQYQSLDWRNSKIAVPLSFLYGLYMAELQSMKLRFLILSGHKQNQFIINEGNNPQVLTKNN